jgi:lysophospholipase L1-like esterase
MKLYVKNGGLKMIRLEQYEWCDFWWQEAPQQDNKRVLLVGDSITRAYRPYVNEQLKGEMFADQLASSRALDNPAYISELDYMLLQQNMNYQGIHFNNGLHGWHLSVNEYEFYLEKVIQHIMNHFDSSKLILALSTPVTKPNIPTELNDELNNKVIGRNKAMEHLAHKYKVKINDLYAPMLGKNEFRVDDGYHYNNSGEKVQAEIVAQVIRSVLVQSSNS